MFDIFVSKLMFPYHSHQHVRELSSDAFTQFLVKFIDSRSQHMVLPHADLVLCIWHNIILGTWVRAMQCNRSRDICHRSSYQSTWSCFLQKVRPRFVQITVRARDCKRVGRLSKKRVELPTWPRADGRVAGCDGCDCTFQYELAMRRHQFRQWCLSVLHIYVY